MLTNSFLFCFCCLVVVASGNTLQQEDDGLIYLAGMPFSREGWAEHLGRSLDMAEQVGRHFYNNFVYTRYFHQRVLGHLNTPGLTALQRDRLQLGAAALDEDLNGVKEVLPNVILHKDGLNFHLYDNGMCSALDMATYRGDSNLAVIKFLVENGADIELKNRYGENALYIATIMGHRSTVHYFLEKGADPNETNRDGISVAMAAAYLGKPDILQMLLEKGASVEPIISPYFVEILIHKPRAECPVAQKVWDLLSDFGNGWRLTEKQKAVWRQMNDCNVEM